MGIIYSKFFKDKGELFCLYGVIRLIVNITILVWGILYLNQALGKEKIKILMLGDSLTAGYGLEQEDSIPERLNKELLKQNFFVEVINAGVSGDTSAGGKSRLGWLLGLKPSIIIIELGANDGLRGLDPNSTMKNLDYIVKESKKRGLKILLTGMKAPPNLGKEYGEEFSNIFLKLAQKYGVMFYPFFLRDVASVSDLNQKDGIHPNKDGAYIIVKNLLPLVIKLIGEEG